MQNNKKLRQKLEQLSKDKLNIVAKKLKIKGYGQKNRSVIIDTLLDKITPDAIVDALNISWWNKYHNHIYGIATLIALILSVIFYIYPMNDNKTNLIKYKPLKHNESLMENPKNNEENELTKRLKETLKEADNYFKVEHFSEASKEYERATNFVHFREKEDMNCLERARNISELDPEAACMFYREYFFPLR